MTGAPASVVLHVQNGDFRFASRVMKQARSALRSGRFAKVELLGLADPDGPRVTEVEPQLRMHRVVVPPAGTSGAWVGVLLRLVRRWIRFYRAGKAIPCHLIHCHSVGALPPSVALGWYHGVPVVYDAHELESQAGQPRAASVLALWIERAFIRRCAAVLCVADSIADWYASTFRLDRPFVVRNVPDTRAQVPARTASPLRQRIAASDTDIVFLYQGALSAGRRIEQLLRVFATLPSDRRMVFMGYGALEPLIRDAAAKHANIHFYPAVPPEEVLLHTAGADVGICGGENVCLSYYYSLPNKLFEYLHAGLPIMVPRWPEMERIVDEHRCGWKVGESDADWRAAIAERSASEVRDQAAGARAAASAFSWSAECEVMFFAYDQALRPSET